MKFARTTLALAMFAVLGLAACGSDDGDKLTEVTSSDDNSDNSDDTSSNDNSETTEDSGDNDDGDTTDCAGTEIPEGLNAFLAGDACEYLECLFDELGVDNADEIEELIGGDTDTPDPETLGKIMPAITKCAPLVTGTS
jgi:hypothetical protein